MSLIKISYDLEKDLSHYIGRYGGDFDKFHYGRNNINFDADIWPSVRKKITEAAPEDKEGVVREWLDSFQKKNNLFINTSIDSLQKLWDNNEALYLKALDDYFGKKMPFKKINCYLTTLSIAPYNDKEGYFFVSIWWGLAYQYNSIMHETMHLYFLNNFSQELSNSGISKESILEINEAVVALLNFEFSNFLLKPTFNNKPSTQDLQDEVVKLWKLKKPFPEILDRLIGMRKIENK